MEGDNVSSRILIAIISFVAGAAAVYGYQAVSANLESQTNQDKELRITEIERQLKMLLSGVDEVSDAQHNTDLDAEALSSKISILGEKFIQFEKKRAGSESAVSRVDGGGPAPKADGTGRSSSDAAPGRRISGEELAEALKEMPEHGHRLLRKAVSEELQRIKTEEAGFETKEGLAKKAQASIKSLSAVLSLAPVQVEQTRDIVARQVEKILESQKVAKERGNLEYARSERIKIRQEAERELVEILTPEQMDKLRELDPEGFGKRYPRGF
jgi:Spy/CpxP family protein refolding chaperone